MTLPADFILKSILDDPSSKDILFQYLAKFRQQIKLYSLDTLSLTMADELYTLETEINALKAQLLAHLGCKGNTNPHTCPIGKHVCNRDTCYKERFFALIEEQLYSPSQY